MKYDKLTRNMQKWPKNTMELGKIQICICGIILELGLTASRWTLTIKLSQFHWGYWQMWHASVHCELHVSKTKCGTFRCPSKSSQVTPLTFMSSRARDIFWWFLDPEAPKLLWHMQPENEMLPFSANTYFLGLYTSSWKGSGFFLSWKWQILQLPFYRRFYG